MVKKDLKNEMIHWADSFAIGYEGNVYFTTSQIHLPEDRRGKYQIIKLIR